MTLRQEIPQENPERSLGKDPLARHHIFGLAAEAEVSGGAGPEAYDWQQQLQDKIAGYRRIHQTVEAVGSGRDADLPDVTALDYVQRYMAQATESGLSDEVALEQLRTESEERMNESLEEYQELIKTLD